MVTHKRLKLKIYTYMNGELFFFPRNFIKKEYKLCRNKLYTDTLFIM